MVQRNDNAPRNTFVWSEIQPLSIYSSYELGCKMCSFRREGPSERDVLQLVQATVCVRVEWQQMNRRIQVSLGLGQNRQTTDAELAYQTIVS